MSQSRADIWGSLCPEPSLLPCPSPLCSLLTVLGGDTERPSAQVSQGIVWMLQKIKGRPRDRRRELRWGTADAVFHASESQASIPPCSQNVSDPKCSNRVPHVKDTEQTTKHSTILGHVSRAGSCYSSLQAPRLAGTWPALLLQALSHALITFAKKHFHGATYAGGGDTPRCKGLRAGGDRT